SKLEGLQSDRGALVVALAGALESSLELLDATEHVLERDRAVLEQHLGGVRGADSHLLFLLAHAQALGAWRHDEARLAARPELRLDRGHDDVDVGDAAVGAEDLLAVDHPIAALAYGARLHLVHA